MTRRSRPPLYVPGRACDVATEALGSVYHELDEPTRAAVDRWVLRLAAEINGLGVATGLEVVGKVALLLASVGNE